MYFNFNFRGIDSTLDIRKLIEFMSQHPLQYPNYQDWIQRSEPEINAGYKQAILSFSDKRIVGNLLYQPHKEIASTLEIKNLRVHPGVRQRYFGIFMLKQLEVEARRRKSIDTVMVDTRASQTDVLSLLQKAGFRETARAPLYDSNEEDVILTKPIHSSKTQEILLPFSN